jgi:C4-type Zn-finger protein
MRSPLSESMSIPECPKCRQPMHWHSSHETNFGTVQATVFHCHRCDRYVAESSVRQVEAA